MNENMFVLEEYSNFARLNGETKAILGTVGVDGNFYPSKSGDSTVPQEMRGFENWASCKNSEGVTFSDYVKTLKADIVDID